MSRTPGAPSFSDVARMRANAETGAVSATRRYQWQLPVSTAAQQQRASNEFPIVPVPKDPYDDIANIKSVYAQGVPAGSNWQVPFEQSDAEYLMRKRDAEEKAEFDAWVTQKYDLTDPSQNLMLQNIAPELFQRREEIIDVNQNLVSAYAKLRLRGAKSLSDLELEWLIETGRLELPRGPIWDPLAWRTLQRGTTSDEEWNAKRYRFGLFSPLLWLTEGTGGHTPTANRADIAGSGTVFAPARVPYPADHYQNEWSYDVPYPYAGANTGAEGGAAERARKEAFRGTTVRNYAPPAPRAGPRVAPAPAPVPAGPA